MNWVFCKATYIFLFESGAKNFMLQKHKRNGTRVSEVRLENVWLRLTRHSLFQQIGDRKFM